MNEIFGIHDEIIQAEQAMNIVLLHLHAAKQDSDRVLKKLQELAEITKVKGE